ncbi:MAG: molybdopterin-dependent oxidoreductase [Bacteroidales bacterium]|jgi:isoquinoline 1-oxidoreductase|nr:molybdopterin-dependent oxidoreductase [Bacteroidales bacterium]
MKKTEIMKQKSSANPENKGIPRRDFVKLLGGGIFIFFRPWDVINILPEPLPQARTLTKDYNAFLHIAADGTVTCYTGKIEMGQGIITSLPVMMADELNVPLEKVKIVMGDTDLCPWDAGTWGSQSTQSFGMSMRAAAAEARGVLLEMASAQLDVPVTQLEAKDGVITDIKNPDKNITYARLSKGQKLEKYLDVKPSIENHTKFTYVGKSYKHVDGHAKVTGQAKYTGDLKLPGMVFARVLRPPSLSVKLISADVSGAEKIDGAKVVRDGDFIAVLSENRDKADEAIVKITAEYTADELKINHDTIFEQQLKSDITPRVVRGAGDQASGRQESTMKFESEYHDGFLAHAPIETHTALAAIEGGKLTVWASTQTPYPLQDRLVRELGMTLETVRVIVPFVGGGFGGKSAIEQAVEAAKLAKITAKPVMVVWTREEEFIYDNFHTAGVVKLSSGIDSNGKIKFWDYHVYYSGSRGSDIIYDVPNYMTTSYSLTKNAKPVHPFATGPWRAPNANTNTFARECQIDIMASAAGIDPLEFRLKNLKDEKMISCLKAVAEKFGYVAGKSPSGRGIGVACGTDTGTWIAHMAEVKVDKNTGKVKVVRIACAQDMGLCVNPEGALIQMEGCLNMGLGYTFTEEVKFEGGKIQSLGFDTYDIPKFSWIPKLDCVILDRKDKAPRGGGEPAIVAVGAVIANAIYDATGARLFRTPMTPERVLEAIRKV